MLVAAGSLQSQTNAPFAADIAAFKKQDSIQFPAKHQILFIGSSSFTKWKTVQQDFPDYKILNRAFGGSTLVDVIRYVASVIFKEAIEALKNKYINRFQVVYILSKERTDSELNFGRIDTPKCEILFDKIISVNADEFFICGPQEMIFSIKDFLETKGVDKKKIHFELFNTVNTNASALIKQAIVTDNAASCNVTIKVDGRSFDFDLPFNTNTILDAALQQGADLPYACKGGMCCTCKAKLVEGNVSMDVNYGLEEDEVKQGFILTCQSHPTTNKVVVDYDIK